MQLVAFARRLRFADTADSNLPNHNGLTLRRFLAIDVYVVTLCEMADLDCLSTMTTGQNPNLVCQAQTEHHRYASK